MRSLIARFPGLERLARLPIASLPTPVVLAPELSRELDAQVAIKRDDLTAADASGVRYGGNKVRKLELILGAALARGSRTIVTTGAIGSHHVLATGLYAREHGIAVEAAVVDQPMTDHVRENLRAIVALGVRLVLVPSYPRVPTTMLSLAARAALRDRRRPLVVGPGGSTALGTIG
ncbi:MAG: pyridoxal-phosphate dependent enzyme, partial [Deltaproteobacteria bacterium]|nr:pyridoxal-phosphate dependent enzyme [Deltaproteobacteria bacterium]